MSDDTVNHQKFVLFVLVLGSVNYETMKWELNRGLMYECRCDERLKDKDEGSTRLTYTGLEVVAYLLQNKKD